MANLRTGLLWLLGVVGHLKSCNFFFKISFSPKMDNLNIPLLQFPHLLLPEQDIIYFHHQPATILKSTPSIFFLITWSGSKERVQPMPSQGKKNPPMVASFHLFVFCTCSASNLPVECWNAFWHLENLLESSWIERNKKWGNVYFKGKLSKYSWMLHTKKLRESNLSKQNLNLEKTELLLIWGDWTSGSRKYAYSG